MKVSAETVVTVAAGLALGLTILYAWKQLTSAAGSIGDAVASGVGAAAGAVATGVDTAVSTPVYAIGDAIGVPRTDAQKCAQAQREGDGWTAAVYCPAGDFLGWIMSDEPSPPVSPWSSGGVTGSW